MLLFAPGALPLGARVVARLTATAPNGATSSADATVIVSSGIKGTSNVSISPSSGLGLDTTFHVSVSGVSDADSSAPLSYMFGYKVVAPDGSLGPFTALNEYSPSPDFGFQLPAGNLILYAYARNSAGVVTLLDTTEMSVTWGPGALTVDAINALTLEAQTFLDSGDITRAVTAVNGICGLLLTVVTSNDAAAAAAADGSGGVDGFAQGSAAAAAVTNLLSIVRAASTAPNPSAEGIQAIGAAVQSCFTPLTSGATSVSNTALIGYLNDGSSTTASQASIDPKTNIDRERRRASTPPLRAAFTQLAPGVRGGGRATRSAAMAARGRPQGCRVLGIGIAPSAGACA